MIFVILMIFMIIWLVFRRNLWFLRQIYHLN